MSKLAERLRRRGGQDKRVEARTRQYLSFRVADSDYGVDILCVQEIRRYEPVSAMPNAPAFMLGVINLRGQVLPVVDLRQRFGLAAVAPAPTTVVIILHIRAAQETIPVGIVVDAVSDVLDIEIDGIRPPPRLGGFVDVTFLSGIATAHASLIKLLDVNALFDGGLLQAAVD